MSNIYLDENLSEYVADALNSLNKGYFVNFKVFSTKNKFGRGAKDEDIIPTVGAESGILITKDIKIQKTRLQYDLCKQHKLGMFFLKLTSNKVTHWEIVKLLILNWERIIEIIIRDKFPFAYIVKVRGKMVKL